MPDPIPQQTPLAFVVLDTDVPATIRQGGQRTGVEAGAFRLDGLRPGLMAPLPRQPDPGDGSAHFGFRAEPSVFRADASVSGLTLPSEGLEARWPGLTPRFQG